MSNFDIVYLAILVVVLIISSRFVSKREKKFKVTKSNFVAKFGFSEGGDIYRELHKYGFRLLSMADDDYQVTNVLHKQSQKEDVYIFDFVYMPKYANNDSTSKEVTIRAAFIQLKSKKLYSFELFPENIIEKIKQLFGSADVDFKEHPSFSKHYVLRSENLSEVRTRFPQSLIIQLEKVHGECIEARETCLLIYSLNGGEFADYEELYEKAIFYNNCLH